ncbi:MAG: family 43 glycosylhydrolase [Cellvibrio sp.]
MRIHLLNRCQLAALLGAGLIAVVSDAVNAACTYTVTNSWGAGYTAAVRITNDTSSTVNGWQVSWTYNTNKVTNSWNAVVSGTYTATNIGWNGTIRPGQSVEFGVQGTTNGGAIETPQLTGTLCSATASSSSSKAISSLIASSSKSSVSSSKSSSSSSIARSSSSLRSSSSVSSNAPNIAGLATATTSYVSPWETLAAVNDNSSPSNSNDKSAGAYGNWNNPNTIEWVQYDWPQTYSLTGTQIYWFDDNGGVLTPTQAYVEYWTGSVWVSAGNVPLVKDAFNALPLNGVVTNRLRVSMLNSSQSTGLLEWRVAGTAVGQPSSSSSSRSSTSSASSSSKPSTCTGPLPGTKGTNPLISGIYTADPAALVHNCTFYITAGHDEGTNGFYLRNWYMLSSTDMVNWSYNGGPVMSLDTFSWADSNAWAGQMVTRNGKFYWYVPVNKRNGGMAIGVAVGDSPLGPFKDAIGAPLVDDIIEMKAFGYTDAGQTAYTIDPTVFIDDDGQAYLSYGGFWRLVTVALNENMTSLKGSMVERTPRDFFEAPYLTKRNGTYYMVYAAGSNPATIDYATSTSPMGPWTYRGRIMDKLPALSGQDAPTSHPAIAEFAGQWYLVYHISNGNGGGTYRRQVAVDKLTFNSDGTIKAVTPSSGLTF